MDPQSRNDNVIFSRESDSRLPMMRASIPRGDGKFCRDKTKQFETKGEEEGRGSRVETKAARTQMKGRKR